jgi:hypothetical protein
VREEAFDPIAFQLTQASSAARVLCVRLDRPDFASSPLSIEAPESDALREPGPETLKLGDPLVDPFRPFA